LEFRGIMGGFYRISEWIMRLSVINVLWVICAIPFFLLGLLTLQTETVDQLLSAMIIVAIVSPFTIFPSTAAMFAVARKWMTGEEDAPLFKTFFRGYKENFKQSVLGGLIYVLIAAILYTNFRFYGSQTSSFGVLRFLVLTLTVLVSVSFFHFFSIMSHLHMKLFQIIKNALLISIGHPIRSISMIACNGIVIYISLTKFTFLIPFFMGSLIAIISFWHFNHIFGRLQMKQQELAEKEAEAARAKEEGEEAEEFTDAVEPELKALEDGTGRESNGRTEMDQSDRDGDTKHHKA